MLVRSKKYTLHDYCRLVHPLTGERQGMTTAFWRFKRLDWGQYIRTKGGATRKLWKRTPYRLWEREAHVFCKAFHVRRFERMFHPEWKEKRHIPDDIYEKYNKVRVDVDIFTNSILEFARCCFVLVKCLKFKLYCNATCDIFAHSCRRPSSNIAPRR